MSAKQPNPLPPPGSRPTTFPPAPPGKRDASAPAADDFRRERDELVAALRRCAYATTLTDIEKAAWDAIELLRKYPRQS